MFFSTSNRSGTGILPVIGKLVALVFAIGCMSIAPFQVSAIAAPADAASIELSRAADALDDVAGQGTSAQIQGKVQKDIGTAKRGLGKVTGQVEGAADQVKGRAQQDIGRVAEAGDQAEDALEDTADSIADSVKDFFGR